MILAKLQVRAAIKHRWLYLNFGGKTKDQERDAFQPSSEISRTYTHSKLSAIEVKQERETFGLQPRRIHKAHKLNRLRNQAGHVWWSQSFCGQGSGSRGIYGAVKSSTIALCCQKPSLNVTALNLAKSNRQERREGENKQWKKHHNSVAFSLTHSFM